MKSVKFLNFEMVFQVKYARSGQGGAVKKRTASKRMSDTKKKKEIERKVKTALRTPERTTKKKKKTIPPKTAEKTTASKAKTGEEKVKKVRGKEKQKPVREKISSKPNRKKAEAKGKSGKKITKTEVSGKRETGKVVAGTRRIRKPEEKAPPKRREKVPPEVAGRVRSSRAFSPKTAEKIKVKVVSEVPETEKISERIVKKKAVPSGVKEVVAEKAKAGTKERPRRIIKGAGEGEGVRRTAGAGQGEAGKVAEAKEITGRAEVQKEALPPSPRAVLPEEYGENSVTLMTVDPYRLFAFWEVREKTLETFRGEVDIRVYDVTNIDFDMMDANSYFDVRADARIGKCYISVVPEREYLADAGIIFDGIFIAIARSARVSTPRATISEEGILLHGTGETDLRTGY